MCALYSADRPDPPGFARRLVREHDRVLEEHGDDVFAVRTRDDLDRVGGDGRVGLMLALEGVEPLAGDPAAFDEWWAAGVRMVGLTHNAANAFAGGIDTPGRGLTAAGRELVTALAARAVAIDLAHASEATFFEVLEQAPDAHVLVSHALCRAVHDHPRNLSDDQLRAIASRGGVLGLMALRLVAGGDGTVDRLVDHADHAVEVMGVEHLCLGADVIDQVLQAEVAAGVPQLPMTQAALDEGDGVLGLRGLTGPEHFGALEEAFRRRGYDGAAVDAVLQGNLLRFLRSALEPA